MQFCQRLMVWVVLVLVALAIIIELSITVGFTVAIWPFIG